MRKGIQWFIIVAVFIIMLLIIYLVNNGKLLNGEQTEKKLEDSLMNKINR